MKKICSLCLVFAFLLSMLSTLSVQAATVTATGMEVTVENGDVIWNTVASGSQASFAILRAYDGSAKDGAFEANYANATAAGVPLGASMVLTATTVDGAKAQATAMMDIISGRAFEYPICVHVGGSAYESLGKATVAEIASAALSTLEGEKYYAVLCVDTTFANNSIDMSSLTQYAVCIGGGTETTDPTDYTGSFYMRRYTTTATVSGVPGGASMVHAYKDFPTIMQNYGLNNVTSGSSWNGVAYNQNHSPWGSLRYGGGSIAGTGCGILSTTNALNYLHGVFDTTDKANTFIKSWASYAHSIDGFNPGSSASGGYRYILFGTDYSNPPALQGKYGSTYNFTMPITWTENWNSANYYNSKYYNNVYVNKQTALKNYLAGNAVAVAHVPGHFICLASYNPTTDKFLVLDSAPSSARGTTGGVTWVSADLLSGGRPALTVGGFCVLKSTKTASSATSQSIIYPYTNQNSQLMMYDGETVYKVGGDTKSKTDIYLHYNKTEGDTSLKMDCTAPATTADGTKIGGYFSQLFKAGTNLTSYENLGFDLYLPKDFNGEHSFKVAFWSLNAERYKGVVDISNAKAGWHRFTIPASQLTSTDGGNLTSIDALTYTWYNTAGDSQATYILVDNVRMFNGEVEASPGEKVKEMIAQLPPQISKEHGDAIRAARKSYDELSQSEKVFVSNLSALETAEAQLATLETADATAAQAVDNKILALPATITLNDEAAILEVRGAYDALTEDQKALVKQLEKLETAEASLQDLKGSNTDFVYGDLDIDGKINAKDALIVLKIAVDKHIPTETQKQAADVTGDGKINAKDALDILKMAVGKLDEFSVVKK